MTLVVNHQEVLELCNMAELIEAIEQGFHEEARGTLIQPARLNVPMPAGHFRIMPAAMLECGVMGLKVFHGSAAAGTRYLVNVYDIESGELLALVDAHYLTAARTGATTGVATKYMAREDAAVVATIGSGLEARTNLEAVRAVRKIEAVQIFSPNAERRERFAAELREDGLDAQTFDDPAAAVAGSDIVIVATFTLGASDPVAFRGAWIEPGMHVNTIGSTTAQLREVDPETFARADILVADTPLQVREESGDVIAAINEGKFPSALALADVVEGRVLGRGDDNQRTVFKSVGTAVQDVAAAYAIYRAAKARSGGNDVGDFLSKKVML